MTCCCALQNGVDVKTVSSMLGHYSAGFTLDTYAHVTSDAQLKAAQTMGSILSRAGLYRTGEDVPHRLRRLELRVGGDMGVGVQCEARRVVAEH